MWVVCHIRPGIRLVLAFKLASLSSRAVAMGTVVTAFELARPPFKFKFKRVGTWAFEDAPAIRYYLSLLVTVVVAARI